MQIKDPIQQFTPGQKAILVTTTVAMFYGTYAYFSKLPDRTVFVKKLKRMIMSQAELDAIQKAKEKAEEEVFQ